jgi:hypothetical protein
MTWLWRKTYNFGPIRSTVSSRGVGWSVGLSFLRFGIGPYGGRYISVSVPGTGISFVKYLGRSQSQPVAAINLQPGTQCALPQQGGLGMAPLTKNQQIVDAIRRKQP